MINILTLNELKELVELTEREDTTWTRWINQATNDVDNLCNGFVLKTFESTTDEYRITKLKYAIANTVEGYDQNARLFGKSGTTTGGGDAPFSLTTQSDNSAIEYKRQDIIKSLVSGGWYKNLAMDLETPLKDELTNEQTTKLVEFLSGLFLRKDGSNDFLGEILNFANGGDIVNSGNIVAVDDGFEKTITGYKIELGADTVVDKANKIYDPTDTKYKLINEVDKIAFFGKELNKALTRQETYNLLSASNTLWNAAFSYEKDVAVLYTFTKAGKEFIGQAISLIDSNMGHNPADGGAFWKVFESTGAADITEIVDKVVEQVEPIIDEKFEVLPTIDYVSEYANQTISFDTEADFEAFKTETGTDDTFYEDVAGGGTGTGDVTLDTDQTITGIKTFENGIKNNLVEVDGKSLIVKNSGGGSNYFEIEQTYTSGYKNWFGVLFFRTTGTSREELSSIQVRQDDGLYISTGNDLIFNAANIKFNNARLQQVRTPTADDDAATKKYADDGLSLKVDKTEIAAIDAAIELNTNNITKNADDILLKADKTDVVDLTSYQEITGQKDFKDAASFYGNLYCFRAPVDKYGVINKENLDKELVYKQNTLIAGTGIDITGDTISSTTVVSPDTALTSKTNTFDFRQVIKSGGSGLLDLQNSTGSVLNTTYDLVSTSVKLTSPNTTSMTFTAKDFNFSDKEIKNVGTPITNKSAANKEYVDTNLALKADKLVVPINASADTSTTINDRVVKVVYKEYTSTGDSVVASTSAGFGYLNASIIRKKSDNSWGIVYNDEFNEVYITSSNQIRFNIKTLAGYTNEIKLTIQHN